MSEISPVAQAGIGFRTMLASLPSADETIGQQVKSARGEVSQRSLASSMRELGHKWSHMTVASVERGERPLRLSEAVGVSDLLGVSLASLTGSSGVTEDAGELAALRRFKRGVDALYGGEA